MGRRREEGGEEGRDVEDAASASASVVTRAPSRIRRRVRFVDERKISRAPRLTLASLRRQSHSRERGFGSRLANGASADPSISKSAISLDARITPALSSRRNATARSVVRWLDVPSTSTKTSYPRATRSSAVWRTHTCASSPMMTACVRSGFSASAASTSGTVIANFFFAAAGRAMPSPAKLDWSSSTVAPSFSGYCSVTRTGTSKIFAARIICELTCTQCSNPWMTGRKRSWTSHTMKIAFSRARRGGDAPTAEATGIAPTRTVVGERERLMTREMRFGGDRRVEACASAIVSESRRSQFPEHTTA